MRAAVVGAGLAGLSVAWHLLEQGIQVVLFDDKGVGGGASGASVGLLHPFPGKRATLSWRGQEGMEATRGLLNIAEETLGIAVASRSGILRPAVTEEQRFDFQKCKGGVLREDGLWIAEGITVFSRLYLQGLWKACENKGAIFLKELFVDDSFDRVILALGSRVAEFEICKVLPPLRYAIGQSLVCKLKKPLLYSIASQGYIAITEDPKLCQIGATYEHTDKPDPKKALDLLDKIDLFYPGAKNLEVLEIRSGVRVSPRDGHRPIVMQIDSKTWVFTALGSRGMLYHALLGKELAQSIF